MHSRLEREAPKGCVRGEYREGKPRRAWYGWITERGVLQRGCYREGGILQRGREGKPRRAWYGWIQEGMMSKQVITNCNWSWNTSF